jgi:hypothetical protein
MSAGCSRGSKEILSAYEKFSGTWFLARLVRTSEIAGRFDEAACLIFLATGAEMLLRDAFGFAAAKHRGGNGTSSLLRAYLFDTGG